MERTYSRKTAEIPGFESEGSAALSVNGGPEIDMDDKAAVGLAIESLIHGARPDVGIASLPMAWVLDRRDKAGHPTRLHLAAPWSGDAAEAFGRLAYMLEVTLAGEAHRGAEELVRWECQGRIEKIVRLEKREGGVAFVKLHVLVALSPLDGYAAGALTRWRELVDTARAQGDETLGYSVGIARASRMGLLAPEGQQLSLWAIEAEPAR